MDKAKGRQAECAKFGLHVLSVALSITLAQIWVGYLLTKSKEMLGFWGMSNPTEDTRALVLFTFAIIGVFVLFEDLDIVRVPAGFGVVKYV